MIMEMRGNDVKVVRETRQHRKASDNGEEDEQKGKREEMK
jgi:hypothetical protein